MIPPFNMIPGCGFMKNRRCEKNDGVGWRVLPYLGGHERTVGRRQTRGADGNCREGADNFAAAGFLYVFWRGQPIRFGIDGFNHPRPASAGKTGSQTQAQERLLVIGTSAAYAGYNSGIRAKSLREFDAEKIAAGVYKVTPMENLADGEYAFCYYASQVQAGVAGRMFSFGVHSK